VCLFALRGYITKAKAVPALCKLVQGPCMFHMRLVREEFDGGAKGGDIDGGHGHDYHA